LNQRPLRPERSALARLSYAPRYGARISSGGRECKVPPAALTGGAWFGILLGLAQPGRGGGWRGRWRVAASGVRPPSDGAAGPVADMVVQTGRKALTETSDDGL
jgi:hypothetical protein